MKLHFIKMIRNFALKPEVDYKTHLQSNHYQLLTDDTTPLPVAGQGTVYCQLRDLHSFNLDLISSNAIIRLTVNYSDVKLYCIYKGRFILLNHVQSPAAALDNETETTYWVSFDAKTRTIRYGKVTSIKSICLMKYTLPTSNKSPSQFWMNKISHYRIDADTRVETYPDILETDAA